MTTPNLSHAEWRKSSHSNGSGGACVEVACVPTVIAVRDSKNPSGGNLAFTLEAWQAFSQDVKHGSHDL
ncbi:DUF397 domain-containing protein [Actinomadura oligospora]|uniref:DUF397 domain-containing protein n=1 Tax=Actinomadura oligospora TaxID=111804 RepID=UPI00047E838D|nr:DUF397 domain-containing protein [Actinomadura oligospora]